MRGPGDYSKTRTRTGQPHVVSRRVCRPVMGTSGKRTARLTNAALPHCHTTTPHDCEREERTGLRDCSEARVDPDVSSGMALSMINRWALNTKPPTPPSPCHSPNEREDTPTKPPTTRMEIRTWRSAIADLKPPPPGAPSGTLGEGTPGWVWRCDAAISRYNDERNMPFWGKNGRMSG